MQFGEPYGRRRSGTTPPPRGHISGRCRDLAEHRALPVSGLASRTFQLGPVPPFTRASAVNITLL